MTMLPNPKLPERWQGDLDDIDMEFKQRVLEHLRIRAEEAGPWRLLGLQVFVTRTVVFVHLFFGSIFV